MIPENPPLPALRYSTDQEDFVYIDINIPCQAACPAFTNIPAYIRHLFEKEYGESYEINRLANILPGVLGRVCSRPCEALCRHGEQELGQPVNICHIKRAAADFKSVVQPLKPLPIPVLDKKIAIVGSGPAGLAAAHDLALIGARVTIYEALEEPGGMLRYGIPEFRLPRAIVRDEIDRILALGVELKTGVRAGVDIAIDTMLRDYDAVLLAAGCYRANQLGVAGEELPGVYSGLQFMMDVCRGQTPAPGARVLVIGAGFTAFDCARSSLRLGSTDVRICLRRTEQDLVVTSDEIKEAKREGVRFESLLLCRRVLGNSKVEGVEFVRTMPGLTGPDGKRQITPIEGSEFSLACDAVIVATGQQPERIELPGQQAGQPAGRIDYHTSTPGLYLAGDFLSGSSTVIEAIANGRKAAETIARDLSGRKFREQAVRIEETTITDRQRTWDFIPRVEMPTVERIADRLATADLEVETGFAEEQALEEARRCYLCYLHYEIDIATCIYCRYCIDVAPRDCIKLVNEVKTNEAGAITGFVETSNWDDVHAVVIDNSRCIRCGECLRVCPVDCISVSRVQLVERILPLEEDHV